VAWREAGISLLLILRELSEILYSRQLLNSLSKEAGITNRLVTLREGIDRNIKPCRILTGIYSIKNLKILPNCEYENRFIGVLHPVITEYDDRS